MVEWQSNVAVKLELLIRIRSFQMLLLFHLKLIVQTVLRSLKTWKILSKYFGLAYRIRRNIRGLHEWRFFVSIENQQMIIQNGRIEYVKNQLGQSWNYMNYPKHLRLDPFSELWVYFSYTDIRMSPPLNWPNKASDLMCIHFDHIFFRNILFFECHIR